MRHICVLKSLEGKLSKIRLNQGVNIIGRSKETGIRDVHCSKEQLQLNVCLETCVLRLKVIGINPCGVNGFMAMKDTECDIMHGDVIEVVYGRHAFKVVFKSSVKEHAESPPESITSSMEVKEQHSLGWRVIDGSVMIYNSTGLKASDKIAGYDIDGTIICTKSGNVFPKNCEDWQILYPQVRRKLKYIYEKGYKICFFSNQAGIAKGKVNADEFKQKIENILKQIEVPVQVFISLNEDFYRKPAPGMWQHMERHENNNVKIKIENCFFVGDAAGRPEFGSGVKKRRKDHSLADRLFAANININFYTPEEHFLGAEIEPYNKPQFDPKDIDSITKPLFEPHSTKVPSNDCEILILVGLPGSGKSHFAENYLRPLGYHLLNADTLKSVQACIKGCEEALRSGRSCVIDNTNVDKESRSKFIDLAKVHRVSCRCMIMNVDLPQIKHNIAYRKFTDSKHSKVNEMVMNAMKKKFKEPTIDEGFVEIIKVNPKMLFPDVKHEELYKLYLVDK